MSGLVFEKALKASRAYSLIQNDIKSGLSHAYIISSGDDDVDEEFIKVAACSLNCEKSKSGCL